MKKHHIIIILFLSTITCAFVLFLLIAFFSGKDQKSHITYNFGHDRDYYINMFDDDYNDKLNGDLVYKEIVRLIDDGKSYGKDRTDKVPGMPEPKPIILVFVGILSFVWAKRRKII